MCHAGSPKSGSRHAELDVRDVERHVKVQNQEETGLNSNSPDIYYGGVMYYTTSGAYRKSKMLIDYANIALTFAIGVVFIIILFLRSGSGILFAVEFMLGALVNGLTAAKNFMSDRTVSGVILTVVTLGLLLMAVIAWRVMV